MPYTPKDKSKTGCGRRVLGALGGALSGMAMALGVPILILLAAVDLSGALGIALWMVGAGAAIGAIAPEQALFLLMESVQGLLRFVGWVGRGIARLLELFQ